MNLLEKPGMLNSNHKSTKKSILFNGRMDLFLILIILVLICIPVLIGLFKKADAEAKRVNLYLSPHCEEVLGVGMTEMLIKDFVEKNPDLLIRLYESEIEPDIFIFDEGDFNALVAEGILARLNLYLNSEDSQPMAVSGHTDEEAVLAVPLVSFMDLLFYNINILTENGFERPPKTRDELLAFSRTLSGNEIAGIAISLNPEDRHSLARDIFSWIWAAGGDFWPGEDGPVLNTRPIINDFSFFGRLYSDKLLAPGIFELTEEKQLEEFAQGRVAMIVSSSRAIPYLREKMGDSAFGITSVPVPASAGKYNICLSGIYAGVSANSENQAAAWRFIEFLTAHSQLFCEMFKAVPGVVSDAIPGEYVRIDPFYLKAQDIFESSKIVRGFSGIPGGEEYEDIIREELKTFFETGRSSQETVNIIQTRIQNVIASKTETEEEAGTEE
jgi:multiple sugar transport system substrate-binding protein